MTQEPGTPYTKDDLLRFEIIANLCKGTVLDVGAGDGKLGEYLQPGHHYTAIDESPKNSLVQKADAEDLPFGRYEFDTVVLAEILEHLVNPIDALMCATWTASHQVIISVPNPFNTDQIASVLWNGYNIENPNHIAMYGDNEIRSLCNMVGGIKKVTPYRFYTRVPGLKWLSPFKSVFGEWNIYVLEV
jgi:SAM-dependent methyltransferase